MLSERQCIDVKLLCMLNIYPTGCCQVNTKLNEDMTHVNSQLKPGVIYIYTISLFTQDASDHTAIAEAKNCRLCNYKVVEISPGISTT